MPDEVLSRHESIAAAIAEHRPEPVESVTPAPEPVAAEPVVAEPDRTRTPDGRFAKAEPVVAEAAPAEQHPENKPLVPRAPNTWRKEAQGKWEAVDPDIKAEIIKRELDAANGIREYKTQAQEAAAYRDAVAPYAEHFKQLGATPVDVVRGLMPSAAKLYFGTPEQKLQALVETAQNFGVDLGQLANVHVPQVDPNIRQIQQQLNGLQQSVQQSTWQQQQAQQGAVQQEQANLATEIDAFAKAHPHFEAVREQMAHLLNTGHAQSLDDAYAMAVYANDELRTAVLQQSQVQQQAQAAQRAKAAAVSVKGGSPTGSAAPVNPQSREDAIRFAIKQHTR